MKTFWVVSYFLLNSVFAAVPTEEGLLKNLNNPSVVGGFVTIKAMVTPTAAVDGEAPKPDFYKWVFSLENPSAISLLQIQYSNAQMQGAQIKDVKLIADLAGAIKKDKSAERAMFYAALSMLISNRSQGMEAFLESQGIQVVRNRNNMNEDKMKLLRAYRNFLINNKGKSDANSPLNPTDPAAKAKIQELFRANMLERAKNVELVKVDKDFLWKVDWKSVLAYFSNEERQLRSLEFNHSDQNHRLESSDYVMLNGVNEIPKNFVYKENSGVVLKIQILAHDTKPSGKEKKLSERFEEAKKLAPLPSGVVPHALFY